MVLVVVYIRGNPKETEEEKKVRARAEDILMNRWKNREHARRNLNNSCDTTFLLPFFPLPPSTPPSLAFALARPSLLSNHPYVIKCPSFPSRCPQQICRRNMQGWRKHESRTFLSYFCEYFVTTAETRSSRPRHCQKSSSISWGDTWGGILPMRGLLSHFFTIVGCCWKTSITTWLLRPEIMIHPFDKI